MDPIQAANILLGIWQVLHEQPKASDDSPDNAATPFTQANQNEISARDLELLQDRFDRLVLVVHAMWALVAEKTGLTDADLLKRITELDAADGTVDGRVLAPPFRCSCGAMVSRRLNRCLFCGKQYEKDSFAGL